MACLLPASSEVYAYPEAVKKNIGKNDFFRANIKHVKKLEVSCQNFGCVPQTKMFLPVAMCRKTTCFFRLIEHFCRLIFRMKLNLSTLCTQPNLTSHTSNSLSGLGVKLQRVSQQSVKIDPFQ